jgi:choline dehydrogenase-like flavoprotein
LTPRERRVLRAFAQALFPGSDAIPSADDGSSDAVAVAEPLSIFLASVSPRVRLVVRLALKAFEWSTFPRRFSRLERARRAAHLERLERASGGVRRELFTLLKALCAVTYARDARLQEALGVKARCALADAAAPPRPVAKLDPEALAAGSAVERCDVVIVGSGAGGAAAARALAERGASVIVIEEGSYRDAETYPSDPLETLSTLYRDGGLTFCEGRPPVALPLGRCVGGTTVVNSGTCFRTPDDVLVRWRDDFGIDWATDLDEQFESLERDLEVKPVDPQSAGRNGAICRAGAEAIGASNGPIARNAPDVVCCGTCRQGCTLDAKRAMHVSELPRAVAAGALIRADARVERVIVEGGAARGVECRTAAGARYEVRARAVLVAAGAVGTPQLLLSQRIANSSRRLGRDLRIHPACWVGARFEEEVRGWEGVMQSWYVDEWSDRGLFLEATFTPLAFGVHWLPGTGAELAERIENYDRLAIIGVHISDRTSCGRVRAGRRSGSRGRITYSLSEDDAAALRFGIARAAEIHFAAGAVEVYPQILGVGPLRSPDRAESFERAKLRARDLRLEAFHPMGTAAMGSDPARSVVSPSGEAHDVPGLYIMDASIFPTSLRVNPMITIMACARRIAGRLAETLS